MDDAVNNEIISTIKTTYPKLYKAAKSYIFFDKKVKKIFDETYGENSINSIIKINDYFKELQNVRNNTPSNTTLTQLARKSNDYFNKYAEQGFLLSQEIGTTNALTFTDILENYLNQQTLPS